MGQKTYRFLFWFPRIVGIIFIACISIFALDIFGQGYTFRQTVVGLFMHLIPSWILIIIMILSWRKYPLVGAIAFTAFGLWYATINIANFFLALRVGEVAPYHYLTWPMIITVPSLGIGLMFFLCRRVKKNPAYNIFYKNK